MLSLKPEFTMSLRAGLVLTLVSAPILTPSFAQPAGPRPTAKPASTPEERKACFPDVEKLCEEMMTQEPSVIFSGLKSHWEKLSHDCRTVLERQDG
jgi:hypothetical protein